METHYYVTRFAKTSIYSSHIKIFNFEVINLLQMSETFRVCKVTNPLLILQVADLYAVPTRLHQSLNDQNQVCELCMFSQIRPHIQA